MIVILFAMYISIVEVVLVRSVMVRAMWWKLELEAGWIIAKWKVQIIFNPPHQEFLENNNKIGNYPE